MSSKPTPILGFILLAIACGKSDEQIIEDSCNLALECREGTEEDVEYCIQNSSLDSADSCYDEDRAIGLCLSNLSCSDFNAYLESDGSEDYPCMTEFDAYSACGE